MFTIHTHGTAEQVGDTVSRIMRNLEVELHRTVQLDDWQMH